MLLVANTNFNQGDQSEETTMGDLKDRVKERMEKVAARKARLLAAGDALKNADRKMKSADQTVRAFNE